MGLDFEWNREKAESNLRKHGISFSEATTVFNDPLAMTIPDAEHSIGEERFWTIGLSEKGRLLVLSHADREDVIRIISARRATPQERRQYENVQ